MGKLLKRDGNLKNLTFKDFSFFGFLKNHFLEKLKFLETKRLLSKIYIL